MCYSSVLQYSTRTTSKKHTDTFNRILSATWTPLQICPRVSTLTWPWARTSGSCLGSLRLCTSWTHRYFSIGAKYHHVLVDSRGSLKRLSANLRRRFGSIGWSEREFGNWSRHDAFGKTAGSATILSLLHSLSVSPSSPLTISSGDRSRFLRDHDKSYDFLQYQNSTIDGKQFFNENSVTRKLITTESHVLPVFTFSRGFRDKSL